MAAMQEKGTPQGGGNTVQIGATPVIQEADLKGRALSYQPENAWFEWLPR